MQSKHNSHVKHVIILLLVVGVLGFIAKKAFTPAGFGKYGYYRASAVQDELNLPTRHMTNDSCLPCHPYIKEMHLGGVHRTVSCEFCHAPLADHVRDGVVVAKMPRKSGAEIKTLCLRCHNRIIRARPKESIKMISMPEHLEKKHVNVDHICDQCHNVHAPLAYVNKAKAIVGIVTEEAK